MKSTFLTLLALAPALLAGEMKLLNGHLNITLPDGAEYGARTTELMGPGPGDDETLIWIGEGADRVAIYARELGAYATADFSASRQAAMQRQLGKQGFEIATTANEGIVYALATKAPKRPSGGDTLAWADVRHEDGTVQRISFLFAENRAADIAACRKLAKEAIESIRPGAPLPLQAREERIAEVDAAGNWLLLPLPEGCHAVHAEGADFLLNNYSIIRPQGEPESGLRLYLGHHPGEPDQSEETRKGHVLGQAVEWSIERDVESGRSAADCLVRVAEGLYTHLIIYAADDKELDSHIRWAEKLNIAKPEPESKKP